MPNHDSEDPVARYVADYIDSVESGTPAPNPHDLTSAERVEAEELISQITVGTDMDVDIDIDIPPIEESKFAASRGIVRQPPAVCVLGDALRRAREAAGLTTNEVASALTALGTTTDEARIADLEAADSTLMAPRDARRLSAAVGVSLETIEATGEPWPAAERTELEDVEGGHPSIAMGPDLVYSLEGGLLAGVIKCRGFARDLDSLTFRRVAGGLLHGEWSHLHAAALVTASAPHKVLVLDAFDCEPRFAAPSGDLGFGASPPAADLDSALGLYNARFGIEWTDPPSYFATPDDSSWTGVVDPHHVQTAAAAIRKSLNRFAEPKSAGCADALDRLEQTSPDHLERLLERIGTSTDDEAESLIAQMAGST